MLHGGLRDVHEILGDGAGAEAGIRELAGGYGNRDFVFTQLRRAHSFRQQGVQG
jgi:hypothetical protein